MVSISGFVAMDLRYLILPERISSIAMMTSHFNRKGSFFEKIGQIRFGQHHKQSLHSGRVAMTHEFDPAVRDDSRRMVLEQLVDEGFR